MITKNPYSPLYDPSYVTPDSDILSTSNITVANTYTMGTFTYSDPVGEYKTTTNDRLDKIEERLLILQPSIEMHEKYPALKDAYDHYKLIEKLVNESK